MAWRHQPAAYSLRGSINRALQAAEACNWRWVSESLRSYGQALMPSTLAPATIMPEMLTSACGIKQSIKLRTRDGPRDSVGEVPPVPWRTVVGSGMPEKQSLIICGWCL